MPETRGFEIVAELSVSTLREVLKAAWDNGGTDSEGAIPHEVPIPEGTSLGPYSVESGQVSIPETGLDLDMAPAQNGVTVNLSTQIQVQMDEDTIPVPSLALLNMEADIAITAPFGIIPGTEQNIGVIFEGMPRSNVAATLTSGDPIGGISLSLIREYVHKLYEDEVIPHSVVQTGQSFLGFTFDSYMQLFDDESDANRDIEVDQPDSTHVNVKIPFELRLSNFEGSLPVFSPMGVSGDLMINASYSYAGGKITCQLAAANIDVENIQPLSGVEGSNYTTNVAAAGIMGIDLEAQIKNQVILQANSIISALDDIEIDVPTVAQIENLIEEKVHEELLSRRYFGAWTPETPEGSDVTIEEVRPKALSTALAIAINPQDGADENALADFIPSGHAFAVGLDDEFVEQTIQDIVDSPRDEGGFGGIPCDLGNIEGHNTDVNSLHWELQSGKIHFWGEVTVHDVFCGADADVDFWADIGLRWTTPDAGGAQILEPYIIDSDADLPWWAWLIAALTFLFDIIIGIIFIVITAIIEKIVERVGGAVMEDEVSGKLQSLGAWPQQLQGIGTVTSTFDEDVVIESSGLIFSGSILISATYGLTMVSPADSGGPYYGMAASPVHLHAGLAHPKISYKWDLGEGLTASVPSIDRIYDDNGLFVVRVTVKVNEPGGATTNSAVFVKAENVPAQVNAGTDIEAFEGEDINFTGQFTDVEYPDTHEAVWFFGDDSMPQKGTVTETNDPPAAKGTVTGKHAYCNNGDYTVTLRVIDKNGGVGEDSLHVKVKNRPPKVVTPEIMYAYPCTPVTLVAEFTDPGWCDTHKGTWKFGDCSAPIPATVKEINLPPQAYGIIAATNTYKHCATFLAEVTVTDSDGASDTATLPVQFVDIRNKDFEGGFRNLLVGTVANDWEPFVKSAASTHATLAAAAVNAGIPKYRAAEFVVHSGQRSQCIYSENPFTGGIYQKVPTNRGWDFQISAWYHINEHFKGVCRLGVDPSGNTDPGSPEIVWMQGTEQHVWDQLAVRVTAKAGEMTIFLESESAERGCDTYFDDVSLQAYPCPLKMPEPPEEPEPKDECVDWKDERKSYSVGTVYKKDNFSFVSNSQQEMRIVLWGDPEDTGKLSFPDSGIRIHLPFEADTVEASVATYTHKAIKMEAFNSSGDLLGACTTSEHNKPETLLLKADKIDSLQLTGGGNEGLLIRLCISSGVHSGEKPEMGKKAETFKNKAEPGKSRVDKKKGKRQ